MDDINSHILRILTQREWEGTVREAVETSQITRYYERYADHCVSIARHIIYLTTGLLPNDYAKKLEEQEKRTPNLRHGWRTSSVNSAVRRI